ncbi:MAG: homoserine dehydrogenase [Planctomycetota bacterium]|nr:homoserine dehydrogenase [Planctomycetota bacterium]
MKSSPLVVLKLGGSVLRDEADLAAAVHEIYRHRRRGARVLAVVSALYGKTDQLEQRASKLVSKPRRQTADAVANLLATGERESASLLVLALERAGVPAALFDPAVVGPDGRGEVLDATPVDLDTTAIAAGLAKHGVGVLPGFVGRLANGGLCLFGRGGTDLTALFVAERLGASKVRLVKDVAGLYEHDPSLPGPPPRRFVSLSWDDALHLGGEILQDKALRYARDAHLAFEVGGLAGEDATKVGDEPMIALPPPARPAPLRVALIGLGSVGGGVYRELAADPEHFDVVSILVRDGLKEREEGALTGLVTTDPERLFVSEFDVLVELAGGVEPAGHWVHRALSMGRHVVTANKALLAERGVELATLAERGRVTLAGSASVGGSIPALEAAHRLGQRGDLIGFEGVLGGTANYVLDRMAEGISLPDAARRAREAGLAEADPRLDLDGTDAAQKLTLLARAAFGSDSPVRWLHRSGVGDTTVAEATRARRAGRALRLVASCQRTDAGLVASLRRRELPAEHPLFDVVDEENAVVFELGRGESIALRGRGAGRWPTVESVMADLFTLARAHRRGVPGQRPSQVRGEVGGQR